MNKEAVVVEDVIVTLEHSSFGSHVFRCQEDKVQSSIPGALAEAKRAAGVRTQVASIDEKQNALARDLKSVHERVAAAVKLGRSDLVKSEQSAADRVQAQMDALAAERQRVLNPQ